MPRPHEKLLAVLACPADKAKLDFDEATSELRCRVCKRVYKVRDGVPVMLVDDETPVAPKKPRE